MKSLTTSARTLATRAASLSAWALIGMLGPSMASAGAQPVDQAMIDQGRYLATASDCIACHTSNKAKPMAGGHAIASPVGNIYAPNITPSKTHGIGQYTEAQFSDAVRKGVRADGARLYPAMPYTAYAHITDEDMRALYVYFMHGVQPVDEPSPETNLPFPMNQRAAMIGWNALFARTAPLTPAPDQSMLWNRGRYLALGPAHCATCHTPRGFFMQENNHLALQGAQIGPWYAPDITSSKSHGIGTWSVDDLTTYLATGRLQGKAQAGGPMAEAVTHSFSQMTEQDLRAISTYILSVPGTESATHADTPNRFEHGQAGDKLTAFRGTSYQAGMQLMDVKLGAQLYSANCASCHGASGQGTRDGYYPSLFGKSITGEAQATNLLAAILNGVDRETPQGGHVFMPPFGDQDNAMVPLDNREIAALANYILTTYGNPKVSVSPDDVQTIREGGPKSDLVLLARLGMGAALLLLALGLVGWRRRSRRRGS